MVTERYQQWLDNKHLDSALREELESIRGNEEAIKDRFYMDLSFGTAGLRGKLGAGTNRMNRYVVARATYCLGAVILEEGAEAAKRGVAIAYDCRIMSPEFSDLAASVLCGMGIPVYLFDELRPTPELSFAIRQLGCISGINVTASHNPKEYNGYKVYWEEGSQIKSEIASRIWSKIQARDLFADTPEMPLAEAEEKGLLKILSTEMDEKFYQATLSVSLRDKEVDKNISIVYTPLNGAGNKSVRAALERSGYHNVHIVKEQEQPDGRFPTVAYPNPEDFRAFEYAVRLGLEKKADILIATDPDSDRVATVVWHDGEFRPLNGNQIGVLLVNYIVSGLKELGKLPANAAIVKSIVTSDMGPVIAAHYGVKVFNVLTGFKNICELPNNWDHSGEYKYIMGYEESIGYNIGDYLRDKDAVASSLVIAEMAAFYKKSGKTLIDVLEDLYATYGYYGEKPLNLVYEGMAGQARIGRMMEGMRKNYPTVFPFAKLAVFTDYEKETRTDVVTSKTEPTGIEKTNCLMFHLDDGCWYALRPSGTEPKLKVYIYCRAENKAEGDEKIRQMEELIMESLNAIE